MGAGKPSPIEERRLWRFLPAALILAGLGLFYALGGQHYLSLSFLAESRQTLEALVAAHPLAAPLGFALLYVLAAALSFPACSILTIFAGFLFGWLMAGIIVAFAATAGATAVFIAARSACGEALRQKVGAKAGRLAAGFERDAFSYMLLLRLAPIFPFFLVNVAPVLFHVRLRTYVAATFIGILPATFVYAYLGTGLGSVLDSVAAAGRDISIADLATPQITLALMLLAVVAAIPLVIRKIR